MARRRADRHHMPAEDGGGRNFDRQALQATLADLVRAAEETPDAATPPAGDLGDPTEAPAAPAPRMRIPTVRAPGQKLAAPPAPDDPAAAPMGRSPVTRPPAAQPAANAPRPTPAAAQDAELAPVPHPDAVRPPTSGRPRLPFGPGQSPSPQGGQAGTVRPGSGGLGGAAGVDASGLIGSVRASSFGGGLGADDDLGGSRTLSSSSGLPGLGGRISQQGDNLARLAPTPVEQPTIALRKRKAPDGPGVGRGDEAGPSADGAGAPGQAAHPAAQQPARPAVAVEPWLPSYDDILPARAARSGRSFRFRK